MALLSEEFSNSLKNSGKAVWKNLEFVDPNQSRHWSEILNQLQKKFKNSFGNSLCENLTLIIKKMSHQNNNELKRESKGHISKSSLVTYEDSNEFLNLLVYSLNKNESIVLDLIPILMLCDDNKNDSGIRFVYIHPSTASNDGNSLEYVINKISVKGNFDHSKLASISMNTLEKSLLFQPHLHSCVTGFSNKYKPICTSSCFNKHMLYMTSINNFSSKDGELVQSFITVDVHSNQVKSLFELSSQNISSVKVNICPVPGNKLSPAYVLFQDLSILKGLMGIYSEKKEIKWYTYSYEDKENNREIETNAQMNKLISSFGLQENSEEDEIESTPFEIKRIELDFTESLWNILKKVQSTNELKSSLDKVMMKIGKGGCQNFWLHQDNNTQLAKLIKSSYQGVVHVSGLRSSQAVSWLIEIGLDCLQRHYVHFLGTNLLCSSEKLKKMLSQATAPVDKLKALMKIHHIVEVAVICQTAAVKLNDNSLSRVVENAFESYKDEEFDIRKVFSTRLNYKDVENLISSESMVLWRADLQSQLKTVNNTAAICLTKQNPFKDLILNEEEKAVYADGSTNNSFYMTTSTNCKHSVIKPN